MKSNINDNIQMIQDNNKKFKDLYELELKNQFLDEGENKSSKFENSSLTGFYFQQFLVLRNLRSLISISLIFLGFFAYRFEFDQTTPEEDGIYLYIFVSIFTLILIIMTIIEKVIMAKRNSSKVILKEVSGEQTWFIILQFLASIIHPNNLFFRKKWITEETYNGDDNILSFKRNFNEYLYLWQLTFLYFQYLKTLSVNTIWASDSSDRIVRYVGFRLTNLYILKCLMRDSKKITVFIILLSTMFYYMIALTVVESPLYYLDFIQDGYKAFIYPSIALWNTMITLFTIGYGDIYVVTYFGRIFVAVLTILAGIILSFVTVAMTIDFDFGDQDKRAFILVNSVGLRQEVEKNASSLIVNYFEMFLQKKTHSKQLSKYQVKFDIQKRKFMDVFNEYKNNRIYDPYYPLFRSMVDLELMFEETEKKYIIQKKPEFENQSIF